MGDWQKIESKVTVFEALFIFSLLFLNQISSILNPPLFSSAPGLFYNFSESFDFPGGDKTMLSLQRIKRVSG